MKVMFLDPEICKGFFITSLKGNWCWALALLVLLLGMSSKFTGVGTHVSRTGGTSLFMSI